MILARGQKNVKEKHNRQQDADDLVYEALVLLRIHPAHEEHHEIMHKPGRRTSKRLFLSTLVGAFEGKGTYT
jgi:hypothetical protein